MNNTCNVIIEIPKGSFIKYEIDTLTNVLVCDRILTRAFPYNYGYIPNTKAPDGDELDVLVIIPYKLYPHTNIKCKIIGYLEMTDEKGQDEKILAVPLSNSMNNINELNTNVLYKIKEFFIHYKDNTAGRWSQVGEFKNFAEAVKLYEKYKLINQ